MRILFVVPYAPNPVRVRPYQLVRALLSLGHDVTLASSWASERGLADLESLGRDGATVIARKTGRVGQLVRLMGSVPTSWPLQATFSWNPKLYADIRAIASSGRVDVVHVEHLRGARYAAGLAAERESGQLGVPVIWDSVDCVSDLFAQTARESRSTWWRWVSHLELGRTRRLESHLIGAVDRVAVASERDREALERIAARESPAGRSPLRCSVISNGVDFDRFPAHHGPRPAATLIFTGKMSYHANVTGALYLLDEVMPVVWRKRADVTLQIVGRDPPAAIRAHMRRHGGRVRVTGEVPDMCPFLHSSTLAVASLPYGVGIQNKVLEAMSTGTPVVATTPALGGLRARAGRDLLVADRPADLAAEILELLDDPERRQELGRAGRAYVERHHDWDEAARSLVAVYGAARQEAGVE